MDYDSDKTKLILQQLKDDVRSGRLKKAMQLLRRADAGGGLRQDSTLVAGLRAALGDKQAADVVQAFARDPCLCCTGGRESCEDCEGKGYYESADVCRLCAGTGLRRCPFCNGTSLAGYDFVPRGLRPSVLAIRLKLSEGQIDALTSEPPQSGLGSRQLVSRIVALDRCRGILANVVEQTRINEVGAAGGLQRYAPAQRVRVEKTCRQANGRAEAAIRLLLGSLAARFSRKAEASQHDKKAHSHLAARAKAFKRLSEGEGFRESTLRTPKALRRD